jgi:hypothetical protein
MKDWQNHKSTGDFGFSLLHLFVFHKTIGLQNNRREVQAFATLGQFRGIFR